MRIDKLTKDQVARMPEWVDKYLKIGLSTAPADFERATDAALRAYQAANLKRPMIVLRMGSPYGATMGGILAWAMLREIGNLAPQVGSQVESQVWSQVWSQVESQVRSQVGSQVWSQVWSQVGSQVWSQVGSQVWSQVRSQVGSQVESQVESQVGSQVESQVWSQVWSQVGSQVESQVWSQVGSQVRSQVGSQVWSQVRSQVESQVWSQDMKDSVYNDRGGAFWASWCAYVAFFRDVCGWQDPVLEKFAIDEQLTRSCGWVWWHENVCAISDRPEVLHRDAQGRLHCEDGPAIRYRDGWPLHYWHGVAIPEYVIERPDEITVPRIESEQNAEIRRVMLSRYGAGRYIVDSRAERVSHDGHGILYRREMPDDEPLVMVRVLNPTPELDGTLSEAEARTIYGDEVVNRGLSDMDRVGFALKGSRPKFKEYFLRVPPQMRTAHEAVAWTFAMDTRAYRPAFQS